MKPTRRQLAVRLAAVVLGAGLLLAGWRLFWIRPPVKFDGRVDLAYVVDSQLLVVRLRFSNQTASPARADCGLQVFGSDGRREAGPAIVGFGTAVFPVELGSGASASLWQPIVISDAEAARVSRWQLACPAGGLYAPPGEGWLVAAGQCRDSARPGSQLAGQSQLTPTSKLTRHCWPD